MSTLAGQLQVHFTKGASGATKANEKNFINNVERRLSGRAGKYHVKTKLQMVSHLGNGVIEVNLQDPTLTGNGNPPVNGGPGGSNHVNATINANSVWSRSLYPDATAGSQAHETFHNLYNMPNWPGQHNPSSAPDLMNGGWPFAGLSAADIQAALDCPCNQII